MRYLITIALSFIVFSVFAQQVIRLDEIKDHIGDSVIIKAKIYGGKYLENVKGAPTFLNVGGNYPNAPLTLVIWENTRPKFKSIPEDLYSNKDVVISGKIILYKNRAEIVITDPKQIE